MTQLRDPLRLARSSYASARYPGDLAAELLPPRTLGGPRRWAFPMVAGGSLAAAVALVVTYLATEPASRPAPRPSVAIDRGMPGVVSPTPVAYQWPARMPLTLPAAPLMPATPPVLVSLDGLPDLQQSYEDLGPRLLDHWNRRRIGFPSRPPPDKDVAEPVPTTRQAA